MVQPDRRLSRRDGYELLIKRRRRRRRLDRNEKGCRCTMPRESLGGRTAEEGEAEI